VNSKAVKWKRKGRKEIGKKENDLEGVSSMERGSVEELVDAEQSVHISPECWNNFDVADFVRIWY